jgi:hypothetical protein
MAANPSFFVKFYTSALTDWRTATLDETAWMLWTKSLLLAKTEQSDGAINKGALALLLPHRKTDERAAAAATLVSVGLFDETPDGYRIPFEKWSKYQTTKAQDDAQRLRNRENGKLGGKAKAKRTSSDSLATGYRLASDSLANSYRPPSDSLATVYRNSSGGLPDVDVDVDVENTKPEVAAQLLPGHESANPDSVAGRKQPRKYRRLDPIRWTPETGWDGITDDDRAKWRAAYPACDIDRQLAAASAWLEANPAKARKSLWRKFLTGWLARAQERGGDSASVRPPTTTANGRGKTFAQLDDEYRRQKRQEFIDSLPD